MSEEVMAPESRAPKKVEIKINVSPELLKQAEKIAERQGQPVAETHRKIWEAGLVSIAQQDTILMINEKTARRLETGDLD